MSNTTCLLAFLPGPWEWILVALVGLLLFGRRLPSVARGLGSSINQFKAGLKDPVEPPKSLDEDSSAEESTKKS